MLKRWKLIAGTSILIAGGLFAYYSLDDTRQPRALDPIVCGETDPFFCYGDHYTALVREKGIAAAFTDLKARYAADSYVRSQCHPLVHRIGNEAAKQFATIGESYTYGDSFCWSGYYHGVMETFVDMIGIENLPRQLDTICSDITGKEHYGFDYYNCVHGLGHGVMAITENELITSLGYCSQLTGDWEQQSCASGAFMENVIVDNLNHFTKYLRPSEPLYPCTVIPEKYRSACYLMQTSYMLKINNADFDKTFALCRSVEAPYRAVCFQSLGRDASGHSTSEVEPTKRFCMKGRDYFEQSNCAVGAVKDFISYFHSNEQAKRFCNALDTTDLTSLCLSTTDSYYAQL